MSVVALDVERAPLLGATWYSDLGTVPNASILGSSLDAALHSSGIAVAPSSEPIEICAPSANAAPGRTVYVLINHSAAPNSTTLPGMLRDLLSDGHLPRTGAPGTTRTGIALPPYGFAVLAPESN